MENKFKEWKYKLSYVIKSVERINRNLNENKYFFPPPLNYLKKKYWIYVSIF